MNSYTQLLWLCSLLWTCNKQSKYCCAHPNVMHTLQPRLIVSLCLPPDIDTGSIKKLTVSLTVLSSPHVKGSLSGIRLTGQGHRRALGRFEATNGTVKGCQRISWTGVIQPLPMPNMQQQLVTFFSTRWGSTNRLLVTLLAALHEAALYGEARGTANPTFHGEAPARFSTCPMPKDFEVGSPFRNCPEIQSHGLPNQNCSNLYILVGVNWCKICQRNSP